MSEVLGRPLREGESVHHRNLLKDDNRPRESGAVDKPPAEGNISGRHVDLVLVVY